MTAVDPVYLGNGSHMDALAAGAADLVITSPPYFSRETELLLRKGGQLTPERLDEVRRDVIAHALALRPVMEETARVLGAGRALVLQTKDIRLGEFLLELSAVHREMFEAVGLHLVTRVLWQRTRARQVGQQVRRLNRRARNVGGFRAPDTEEFLVLSGAEGVTRRASRTSLSTSALRACIAPVWRLPPGAGSHPHPFQSPASVLRRFIALFTAPGDLVVDPFAGHGTALRIAVRMGRRAVGYEIDPVAAAIAQELLARASGSRAAPDK